MPRIVSYASWFSVQKSAAGRRSASWIAGDREDVAGEAEEDDPPRGAEAVHLREHVAEDVREREEDVPGVEDPAADLGELDRDDVRDDERRHEEGRERDEAPGEGSRHEPPERGPGRRSRRASGSPAGAGASTRTTGGRRGRRCGRCGRRRASSSASSSRTPRRSWNSYRSGPRPRLADQIERLLDERVVVRRDGDLRAALPERRHRLDEVEADRLVALVGDLGRLDVDALAHADVRARDRHELGDVVERSPQHRLEHEADVVVAFAAELAGRGRASAVGRRRVLHVDAHEPPVARRPSRASARTLSAQSSGSIFSPSAVSFTLTFASRPSSSIAAIARSYSSRIASASSARRRPPRRGRRASPSSRPRSGRGRRRPRPRAPGPAM